MVSKSLTTLAFDADDTLWHNEVFFKLTQDRFEAMLAPYCDAASFHDRLLQTERRNIGSYGYGVKGFTLSVIEVAIEASGGKVPSSFISEILEGGRELLAHPVELLPGVKDVLTSLSSYRFVLITKGDLMHQEEKLAASGLGELFDAVHVVSEKNEGTYRRILRDPGRTMMIGNSMRSDVLPALAAGAFATHIPFEIEWELERANDPEGQPRFARIENMAALPQLLAQFG